MTWIEVLKWVSVRFCPRRGGTKVETASWKGVEIYANIQATIAKLSKCSTFKSLQSFWCMYVQENDKEQTLLKLWKKYAKHRACLSTSLQKMHANCSFQFSLFLLTAWRFQQVYDLKVQQGHMDYCIGLFCSIDLQVWVVTVTVVLGVEHVRSVWDKVNNEHETQARYRRYSKRN